MAAIVPLVVTLVPILAQLLPAPMEVDRWTRLLLS